MTEPTNVDLIDAGMDQKADKGMHESGKVVERDLQSE